MKQRCPDLLVYDICSISHSHLRDAFISQCGNFTVWDFGGALASKSQEDISGHRAQPSLILSTPGHIGVFPSQLQHARPCAGRTGSSSLANHKAAAPAPATSRHLGGSSSSSAMGSFGQSCPGHPLRLLSLIRARQVSQDSTAANSLRDSSCCFGLGFFDVFLFFCSSQMKFRMVSKCWHKCEGNALRYWQKAAVP